MSGAHSSLSLWKEGAHFAALAAKWEVRAAAAARATASEKDCALAPPPRPR